MALSAHILIVCRYIKTIKRNPKLSRVLFKTVESHRRSVIGAICYLYAFILHHHICSCKSKISNILMSKHLSTQSTEIYWFHVNLQTWLCDKPIQNGKGGWGPCRTKWFQKYFNHSILIKVHLLWQQVLM